MNPYVLLHAQTLAEENQTLIGYLADAACVGSRDADTVMKESMKSFVSTCRQMLLYTEKDNVGNEAALRMDIRLGGYDRGPGLPDRRARSEKH